MLYTTPAAEITLRSTIPWREWWVVESKLQGTDWQTLGGALERALHNLRVRHVGASS